MTAKKTVPATKKPMDRLRPAADGTAPPPGAELLPPMATVPVWEQERLLDAYMDLAEAGDDQRAQARGVLHVLRGLADLVADEHVDAWREFCSGPIDEVFPRINPVIEWYLGGQAGNSAPSGV